MTITVNHPVLGAVKFPDTATPDEISATLLQIGADVLPEKSSGEVFFNQMGEGLSDTFEGLAQLTGLPAITSYEDEFRNRVELETNPYAGYSGLLIGSILDPVTLPAAFLKPIKVGGKLLTGAARGATAGTLGGAGGATFEEFGDDRLTNTLVGSAFGAGIGGVLSRYIARDVDNDAVAKTLEDTESAVYGQAEPTALSTTRARTEAQATPETAGVRPDTPFTPKMQTLNPEKQLESELVPVAQRGISYTSDEYKNRRFAFEDAKAKLKDAETRLSRAGNNEAQKLKASNDVTTAKSQLDRTKAAIDEVKEANKAQSNLNYLRAGNFSQLSPEATSRLNQIKLQNVQSAKLQPVETTINGKVVEGQPVPPPVTPRQTPEGTQRVEVAQPEEQGFAPLGTGFEGRSSAGSMGVDPSKRYAGQVSEGVDESAQVQAAWSRRQVSPAEDTGAGLTEMDRMRLTMLEEAAAGRLRKLMSHEFGEYSFKDNPAKLQQARKFIAEDYDSLVDFLMDAARKNRVFNAEEQDLLEPILREAEQRVIGTFKAMRTLRAKGGFKSTNLTDDEYDMVMELQFYSYVADAIKTNGTRASHSLKNQQKIKIMRGGHKRKLDSGKPIDDIFGVQC